MGQVTEPIAGDLAYLWLDGVSQKSRRYRDASGARRMIRRECRRCEG
jgi:hypothetical protein